MRWDGLGAFVASQLPTGAVITAASMVLSVSTFQTNYTLAGGYMTLPWNASYCCLPTGCNYGTCNAGGRGMGHVGWGYTGPIGGTPSMPWTVPGALNDTVKGTSFVIGGWDYLPSVGTRLITQEVPLDLSIVTGWMTAPTSNNGVVVYMSVPPVLAANTYAVANIVSGFYTPSLGAWAPYRPQIRLTWAMGATPPSPPARPLVLRSSPRAIYVDAVAGDDVNGNGDVQRPLATLDLALANVQTGGSVILRAGVYPGGVNLDRYNVTVQSYPGERAIISCIIAVTCGIVFHIRPTASYATIRNLEIQGGQYYGILVDSSFDYGGTYVRGFWTSIAARNVLIDNVVIHNTGSTGIRIRTACASVTIRRSRIFNVGYQFRTYGHAIEALGVPYLTVEDNHLSDGPGAGVTLPYGNWYAVVRRNYIANMDLGGVMLGWYSDTDYLDLAVNPGLYACLDCAAYNNIIFNCGGAGVGIYSALRPFVGYNTIVGTAQYQQNPILIAPTQIYISYSRQPIIPVVNATIINNIVVKDVSARKAPVLTIRSLADCCSNNVVGGLVGPLVMTGNVYYAAPFLAGQQFVWGTGAMFDDERPAAGPTGWTGNLTGWQTLYGVDAMSVEADPLLAPGTFAPLSCSPAASIAQPVPLNVLASVANDAALTDYFNAPRTAGVAGAVGSVASAASSSVPKATGGGLLPVPPATPYLHPNTMIDYTMGTWKASQRRVWIVDAVAGVDCVPPATCSGNLSQPFKTVGYAFTRVFPGDTIQLRGGNHTGGWAVIMPNVTIESYPGEWAVVSCSYTDPNCGVTVRMVAWGQVWNTAADVTIRNLEITGGYYYALMNNQMPSWYEYWNAYCAWLGVKPRGYILVQGVYMHSSGTSVVKLSPFADGMTFDRVEIAYSGLRGTTSGAMQASTSSTDAPASATDPSRGATGDAGSVGLGSGNGIDNRNGNFMTVQDSYIHDIRGTGILMGGGARNCLVQRNLVNNVDVIGILVGSFDTEVMYHDVVANPLHYGNIGAMVRNNIVWNAGGAGIALYSSKDALVVHNTLINVAFAMQAGILLNLSPELDAPTVQALPPNVNVTLMNNIVQLAATTSSLMFEIRVMQQTVSPSPPASPPNTTTCPASPSASAGGNAAPLAPRNPDGSCPFFPPTHPMNQRVDALPVHPMSATWIKSIGVPGTCALPGFNRPCGSIHPDFGGGAANFAGVPLLYGIPINYVNRSRDPAVTMTYTAYPAESDPPGGSGIFNIAPLSQVEGAIPGCLPPVCGGDRHLLLVDNDTCTVSEFWQAQPVSGGASWTAANGAIFNLLSDQITRPAGWTSADAAGLSIAAGLIKYSEVMAGEIKHALRMTVSNLQKAYVSGLATHYAAYSTDPSLPPMGLRLRLKASYDCTTGMSFEARVICVAMQRYGVIIADTGSDWYITGEANPNWNVGNLANLRTIPGSAFEAVDSGKLCFTPDCSTPASASVLPIVSALADYSQLRMSGNVFFHASLPFAPITPSTFVDRLPTRYYYGTFPGWQNASGACGTTVDADPLLNGLFVPAAASPALTAGAALPIEVQPVMDDFFGRSRSPSSIVAGALLAVASQPDPRFADTPNQRKLPGLITLTRGPCTNATVTNASAIYVNAAVGNDANCDPTPATPLRSLSAALLRVMPGATIYLSSGRYRGTATFTVPNVTVTWDGSGAARAALEATTVSDQGPAVLVYPSASNCMLRNVDIIGGYRETVALQGVAGFTVQGCTIRGSGEPAVLLQNARNVLITGNLIKSTGQRTPRLGDGVSLRSAADVVISGNVFDGIRSSAVHIQEGSARVAVQGNTISNSERGVVVGSDHAQFTLMDPLTYDPDDSGTCTWFDASVDVGCRLARNVDVTSNLIRDVDGSGIIIAASDSVHVAFNTLMRVAKGHGAGVELFAAQKWVNTTYAPIIQCSNVLVSSNIITQTNDSVMPIVAWRRAVDYSGTVSRSAAGASVTFANNVYWKFTGPAIFAGSATGAGVYSPMGQPLPYASVWYQRSGSPRGVSGPGTLAFTAVYFMDDGPGMPAALNGATYLTSTQWMTIAGRDAASAVSNPLLDGTLTPTPGSPAIAAGDASLLTIVPSDFNGGARASPPACGAIEPAAIAPSASSLLPSIVNMPPADVAIAQTLAGPRSCNGDNVCYIPGWHTTTPTAWSEASVWTSCLNKGFMFPAGGSEWNRVVTGLPRHPMSDTWITTIGTSVNLWPAFGSVYNGGPNGFMFAYVAGSSIPKSRVSFAYAGESDNINTGYPLLPDLPVEDDASKSEGDRHVLVVDKDSCTVYELFKASLKTPGESAVTTDKYSYLADSGAVWSMSSNGNGANGGRPAGASLGWTSTDAAGLSVFAGLITYYEVMTLGVINHAIRFTVPKSGARYLYPPATHYASPIADDAYPPMGMRMRLMPSFNCTAQLKAVEARVICRALQQYGMILADNGGAGALSGQAHPAWNDAALAQLRNIPLTAFEAVSTGAVLCRTPSCSDALPNGVPAGSPF